ncbi:hypothetical protein SXANM310S_05882 [Streptomyces xanthochromogenes]|uniref:Lipoprotein n=2 Tax=Streptomyces xanthochromogenes TaxID=67384 RepID=A0ABQ2ZVW5_9ACTN|nr:hypothetical protein GCM10010326_17300 [Streptomyces xanthochromogenes]
MSRPPSPTPAPTMIQTFRTVRATALAAIAALGIAAVVLAISGCGERSGLVEGDRASPVALQPGPEELWPAWYTSESRREGVMASGRGEPPAPLDRAPKVPKDGLRGVDPMAVLKADPRGRPLTRLPLIHGPGKAGIRPPAFHDLTGDGGPPEMIIAADLENRRTAVIVYSVRDGRIVPILYTTGSRLAVEAVGTDLVTRGAAVDGAEQVVRYRWDGVRLSPVRDDKTYKDTAPGARGRAGAPGSRGTPGPADGAGGTS